MLGEGACKLVIKRAKVLTITCLPGGTEAMGAPSPRACKQTPERRGATPDPFRCCVNGSGFLIGGLETCLRVGSLNKDPSVLGAARGVLREACRLECFLRVGINMELGTGSFPR